MYRRRSIKRLLYALPLLLSTSCSSTKAPESKEQLKLGALLPITGAFVPGSTFETALQLAIEDANASQGTNTRKVSLIIKDTKSTPEGATQAAQELLDEGVQLIVGAVLSSATKAALNVTIPAGALLISGGSTSPSLTNVDNQGLFFRTAPRDDRLAKAFGKYLAANGVNEFALIANDSIFTRDIADITQDTFEKQDCGLQPCSYARYTYPESTPPDDPILDDLVKAALKSNPEVIFISGYAEDTASIIARAEALSFQGTYFMTAAFSTTGGLEVSSLEVRKRLNWIDFGPRHGEGHKRFMERASARIGATAPLLLAPTYDAAMLLILAVHHARSTDPALVAQSLWKVANQPGQKVSKSELTASIDSLHEGNEIDYEGLTLVEFDQFGDSTSGQARINRVDDNGMTITEIID